MSDPRVRQLAELLVERCLDVQPGWQVTVRSTPLGRPLVDEVARAIGRRGAYALTRLAFGSDRFRVDSEWAREAPLDARLGEIFAAGNPLGGIWDILAWSDHGRSPDERLARSSVYALTADCNLH